MLKKNVYGLQPLFQIEHVRGRDHLRHIQTNLKDQYGDATPFGGKMLNLKDFDCKKREGIHVC